MTTFVKEFTDPAIIKWKWRTEMVQQYYCDALSDRTWELYEVNEYIYLAKKVAFAIFGLPHDDNIDERGLEGYEPKQREIANKIKDKIVELKPVDNDLHVAFLFVCCKFEDENEFPEPVFRVLRNHENGIDYSYYVDTCGRVYTDWGKFLQNNILPECIFCYPENGYYEYDEDGITVKLGFAMSPACSISQKMRKYGDTAGTVLSFAAAGVGVSTLFTPIGPIVALGALATGSLTGVYAGFRGAETVIDRKTHGQSISLSDSEARGVWLNIAATALGTVAGAANAALLASAKAGEVFSKSARAAINVLNISNVSVNGVVIADRLVYMVEKYRNGKLSTLDVLQFSTSVFFFTNSLISLKTARAMIKDAQAEIIGEHQETLPVESLPGFKADLKNARKEARSTMYGNGRVIKRINRVDSGEPPVQTLTQPLGIAGDDENTEAVKAKLPTFNLFARSPSDPVNVGAPSQVATVNQGRIFQIFSAATGAAKMLDQLCSEQNIGIFRANINTWVDNAWRAFKTKKWNELEINGVKIFQNLHPFEEDRLGQVMQAPGNDFNPEVTDAAVTVAKRQKCKNATEFVNIVDQVSTYVNDNAPTPVVRNLLLNDLKNPKSESFKDLVTRFQIKTELTPFAMTYHFYRYTSETFRELTQYEEHLKICRELFGEDVNSSNSIFSETHEGHVTVTYIDTRDTLYSIVIEHLPHADDITYFKTTVSILDE